VSPDSPNPADLGLGEELVLLLRLHHLEPSIRSLCLSARARTQKSEPTRHLGSPVGELGSNSLRLIHDIVRFNLDQSPLGTALRTRVDRELGVSCRQGERVVVTRRIDGSGRHCKE